MYNVRFKGSAEVYRMNVKTLGASMVQLFPPFPDVDLTVGFELLTRQKGGKVFGKYLEYTTIYREMDDGSIILSNDGSVWVPPPEPEPVPEPEPYVPTLEEVKTWKKQEVGIECNAIIAAGIDVTFPDGTTEHFSLEENGTKHDQINLFGKQAQLAAGIEKLEYHQDGHPCKYYSAEDMQKIITAAMEHVSYHTTYCNALNMWIAGAESVDEVNSIYYGAEIPEEYQSEVLKDYLAKIMAEAEAVADENKAVS